MAYKFFDKKPASSGFNMHAKLAEELQKRIIKEFNKRTVQSGFKDSIWDTDLADMQLISNFNKRFRFLLCVIDIFSKYAWVVPLKDKKGVSIVNLFRKYQINRKVNQTKYELIKEVNSTIVLLKNG